VQQVQPGTHITWDVDACTQLSIWHGPPSSHCPANAPCANGQVSSTTTKATPLQPLKGPVTKTTSTTPYNPYVGPVQVRGPAHALGALITEGSGAPYRPGCWLGPMLTAPLPMPCPRTLSSRVDWFRVFLPVPVQTTSATRATPLAPGVGEQEA
jgi:hypothetical protein